MHLCVAGSQGLIVYTLISTDTIEHNIICLIGYIIVSISPEADVVSKPTALLSRSNYDNPEDDSQLSCFLYKESRSLGYELRACGRLGGDHSVKSLPVAAFRVLDFLRGSEYLETLF